MTFTSLRWQPMAILRRRDHRGARVISGADVGAAGEHLRASVSRGGVRRR